MNRSYNLVIALPATESAPPVFGLARIDPEGAVIDTLLPPGRDHLDPMVHARDGDQTNSVPVPFTPRYQWTFSPLGYFVHGLSDEYRILLDAPGAPLRVERPGHVGARVVPDEAEAERRAITRNMRNTEPGWSWNGPDMPDVKPPFEELLVGRDGRVWVRVHQTARRVVETVRTEAGDETIETWVEPLLFDVFEPDGSYLGAVRGPETGMSFWASPVMDGDRMWAVTWDALDVAYVVRYRVGE